MTKIKLGIIKEGKVPVDHRVPFTPDHTQEITSKFDNIDLVVQSSDIRCFKDEEYQAKGATLVDDVSDCDILVGVKEVPLDQLIPHKTYFFFSHTTKKQPYNRELLKSILDRKIRLIDYENLTNQNGTRVVAFGRYAGIVGAYNAILTYGMRYNLFHLKPAHQCFDMDEMIAEYEKVDLPSIKIALTGGGRVSKGAMEVLYGMGVRRVSPYKFVDEYIDDPVFTQLNARDYHRPTKRTRFSRKDFYKKPQAYKGNFFQYAGAAEILIAGAFWNPKAPVLFTKEDVMMPYFNIKVIADITCDINGSIPSTKRPSTIDDPIYDYNPSEDRLEDPMTDEANITVMAVDNLPCELPRNASEDFGRELIDNVLPHLLGNDAEGMIDRATIAKDGNLTHKFSYLQDFVEGKE